MSGWVDGRPLARKMASSEATERASAAEAVDGLGREGDEARPERRTSAASRSTSGWGWAESMGRIRAMGD